MSRRSASDQSTTDFLAARRDAAALTTRCTVDGCDWSHTGAAGEGRDAAVEHRRAAHPGVLLQGINPKAKTKPKHPSVQTDEDRKIVRDLAARQRAKKKQPAKPRVRASRAKTSSTRPGWGAKLTPEMIEDARRRYADGEAIGQIARASFVTWGFVSAQACQRAVARALRGLGVEITRGTGGKTWSRLTPARIDACKRLYVAGISSGAISELVWERYGYGSLESCRMAVIARMRRDGVQIRPHGVQVSIPELNRREAVEIIDAAERPQIAEAA